MGVIVRVFELPEKLRHFMAFLIQDAAEAWWNRTCEDIPEAAREVFTKEQKEIMSRCRHEWNGDPEEYIPGYFSWQGGLWLDFFVAILREEVPIPPI